MDIQKPVKDKVKYYVSPKDFILFYLNYDKVKRICVFCGLMFHSVQHCPNRSKLIRHLQSIKANTDVVPFSNIGIWTSQAMKIPQDAFQQSNYVGSLPLELRRDMKMERTANANYFSLTRFKSLEEQSDQSKDKWKSSENMKCSYLQPSPWLALKPPPRSGSIPVNNQLMPAVHHPHQRLKR
ncbi:hypothetical protein ACQ4PT_010683 [Festuca glaucescens]